jgi:hypothetical protein
MHRMQVVNRFQFHDDAAFDQKVQFELTLDALTLVLKWDMALALDAEMFSPHFDDHALSVHRLQQPRPERPVDFNGAANHFLGQGLDVCNIVSHVRSMSTNRARSFSEGFAEESLQGWQHLRWRRSHNSQKTAQASRGYEKSCEIFFKEELLLIS